METTDVRIVPSLKEFANTQLEISIFWWSKADFAEFKLSALTEFWFVLKNYANMNIQKARELLYGSEVVIQFQDMMNEYSLQKDNENSTSIDVSSLNKEFITESSIAALTSSEIIALPISTNIDNAVSQP